MSVRIVTAAALGLALAACGGADDVATTDEGADAQGEILGGSISDEMVQLEQVRSASPPAKKAAGEGGDSAGGSGGSSGDDGDEQIAAEAAEPAGASEAADTEESAEEG